MTYLVGFDLIVVLDHHDLTISLAYPSAIAFITRNGQLTFSA